MYCRFEHVYESYPGEGKSVYANLARFVFSKFTKLRIPSMRYTFCGTQLGYRKEFFQYGNRALMELEREGKT